MLKDDILVKASISGRKLGEALEDQARKAGAAQLVRDIKAVTIASGTDAKTDKLNDWTGDYLALCLKGKVSPFGPVTTTVDVNDKLQIVNAITGSLTGKE